jgi:hypothetical protein
MSPAIRVAGFLAALAAVFGLALGAGRTFGPAAEPAVAAHEAHAVGNEGASLENAPAAGAALPGGLMTAQDGYSLTLADSETQPGRDIRVAFTIEGPDGLPVTAYEVEHEQRLHLIAVRRDFTGFQHVHPQLSPHGKWSTTLDLTAGQWRLFADFTPAGAAALTLGADLAVAGDYQPATPAGESRTSHIDGYRVTLDGDLAAGGEARLTLSVSRGGEAVTDLQPYLGAYGHLVALREGDLAYLHVHPDGAPGDGTTQPGPDVVFHAAVPSAGTYHLFLDFRHQGVVRTAAFTVSATGTNARASDGSGTSTDDGHSPH